MVPQIIIDYCNRFQFGNVIKGVTTFAVLAVSIWATVGSYATHIARAVADDAVVDILKRNGIDPPTFQQMQKQLDEAAADAERKRLENLVIQSDLNSVKAQNRQIIDLLTKGEEQ